MVVYPRYTTLLGSDHIQNLTYHTGIYILRVTVPTQTIKCYLFDTDYIWPSPYIITSPDVIREYDTEECECADGAYGF